MCKEKIKGVRGETQVMIKIIKWREDRMEKHKVKYTKESMIRMTAMK